jgi:pyruvate formate lyase activating enzyme
MKRQAMFFRRLDDNNVECFLCAHGCRIAPGNYGICRQRQNIGGTLYTYAYGAVVAANIDPIEKKPLYHFMPKTMAFSIATAGCNFRCGFCQNWQISQAGHADAPAVKALTPRGAVESAIGSGCASIAYTYTEPTIFFEYTYDIAVLARENGLRNVYVTNGYIGKEALEKISTYLDAANIDLKSFNDGFYRNICKARLQPVLDTIKRMKSLGIWIEITTLLVPGINDSQKELRQIAGFIAGIDTNIPWHISRMHPDYRFQDMGYTSLASMEAAMRIGKEAGLMHVYMGNVRIT